MFAFKTNSDWSTDVRVGGALKDKQADKRADPSAYEKIRVAAEMFVNAFTHLCAICVTSCHLIEKQFEQLTLAR